MVYFIDEKMWRILQRSQGKSKIHSSFLNAAITKTMKKLSQTKVITSVEEVDVLIALLMSTREEAAYGEQGNVTPKENEVHVEQDMLPSNQHWENEKVRILLEELRSFREFLESGQQTLQGHCQRMRN